MNKLSKMKKKKKKSSRKKKDLAFKLMLEDSEVSDDEDITLTHKFKRFICSKGCFKRMENKEIAKRKEVEYNKETKKDIKKDKSHVMDAMNMVTCKMSVQIRRMISERKFSKPL